jgi:hypothetical protein
VSESIAALELAEIEALTDLYDAASPEVVAASGLSVRQVGDAMLIAVSRVDVLALNSPRCFVPVAPTINWRSRETRPSHRGRIQAAQLSVGEDRARTVSRPRVLDA